MEIIDYFDKIRKLGFARRMGYVTAYLLSQVGLGYTCLLYEPQLFYGALSAIGMVFYKIFPILKYFSNPRAPLIVLDDVNVIFSDKKLKQRFFPIVSYLLNRMDYYSCNAIFMSSDLRCEEHLTNISEMRDRIRIFHIDEIKKKALLKESKVMSHMNTTRRSVDLKFS